MIEVANAGFRRSLVVAFCLAASSCSGLVEVRAVVPEGDPPEHLRLWFERIRDGTFRYRNERCWFVRADDSPPALEFECGELIVGLLQGIDLADISNLLRDIEGVVVRDLSGVERLSVTVTIQVPRRREGSMLLVLLTDPRVGSATPNWVGGTVLGQGD